MASDTLPTKTQPPTVEPREPATLTGFDVVRRILMPLASLKITVVLFAMAIFIVLAGTLAQAKMDLWYVVDAYFRTAFARIEFDVFFPDSFFPHIEHVPGFIYFPGGWLIGAAMMVNLIAAHAVRFKAQARGSRLFIGCGVIALGALTTLLVILSGSSADGFQQAAWIEWAHLWILFKVGLAASWLGLLYGFLELVRRTHREKWLLVISGASVLIVGGLLFFLLLGGSTAQLGDSSMRILWQLSKATAAAGILLAGCVMVFRKRGGIVLLHAGVGLLMLSELLVGTTAEEGVMRIREGETSHFIEDQQNVELAVVDPSQPKVDHQVVIPEAIVTDDDRESITDPELPFDIQIVKYMGNTTDWKPVASGKEAIATRGRGVKRTLDEAATISGTDTQGRVNTPAAFVKLTKKNGGEVLGTWLLSVLHGSVGLPEPVEVDGKEYEIALRFRRTYLPYFITLNDVRKQDYVGTDTPMDYRSEIRLRNEAENVDREIPIWMNNPLRYAGATFYQSGYTPLPDGSEMTTLQVVTNSGWMIPYVACMIVVVGMLAQFSITLMRFLDRRESGGAIQVVEDPRSHEKAQRFDPEHETNQAGRIAGIAVPVLVVLAFGGWALSKARLPSPAADEMHLYEFGQLPVVEGGRVKPLDTLARTTMRIMSNRQTFLTADDDETKQPAIRWLLDVASGKRAAFEHRVLRIDNPEVLELLDLKPRKHHLYSMNELEPRWSEFVKQAKLAQQVKSADAGTLSAYQRKVLELQRRWTAFVSVHQAFDHPPGLNEILRAAQAGGEDEKDAQGMVRRLMFLIAQLRNRYTGQMALAVPAEQQTNDDDKLETVWKAIPQIEVARLQPELMSRATGTDPPPLPKNYVALRRILDAAKQDDAQTFNAEVARYRQLLAGDSELLASTPTTRIVPGKLRFETFFNHFEPFYYASVLYLIAFLLAAMSWLGWAKPLNRAAFWLIAFTFVLHTLALVGRIYISGRPPVTNLYGSALFIGWFAVLLGMIFEGIYRMGIGNAVGAMLGFGTLVIAHLLTTAVPSFRGDTFTVLQAVLDTQFWLATHVVCITIGYAVTFVAGILGIIYVLGGVITPALTPRRRKDITRMIYGTLCFGLLFSFFGTVLGGLWADDSWGRFWGWDPKENGALIIVLWNALVLHARWGGMVKEHGLAVLAVAGNIAVGWSWFGVNELGVGLHSYGFTEGVLLALGLFIASQLAIIGIGLLPRHLWVSR